MKYIVCEKPGEFLLKEKEAPIRQENEALLQINKVGICGTDLHAYAGNQAFFTYPRILGHELASTVLEIGDNPKEIKAGDKVVVMPYISCQKCIACRNGKTNCCTNIKVLGVHTDGGMQEQITVPANILLPANHLSNDQMAIVEPLAIGAHAVRRAAITAGETVAVIGCGPIGIGIMKLAQIAGAKVIAIDMNEQRLAYAKEKIGVDYTLVAGENTVEAIKEITNGDLCTAVFDASGHKGALETAPKYMSHGGRFVLVGLSKGEIAYSHPAIHAKEMTLMCSRNATTEDFEHVINIIDQFPTESFITHSVPFNEMIKNFDSWLNTTSGVIKATVVFNS
ncbi:2-desacetyl-2-hydroxyethyl bacteriochlorophyllide A dehydrogenase [Flavobacterium flevense]|uniref:Alcohol dehydrogenase n=1 Tax=Flavobacterium flevense TaxID=983 RepID=A0A4Y4AW63_9FLAO|nr:zinc-binding alcohol dehydrogenase family protein [Flavobacterium flevense]GEC72495.1 alcohol dehydrogenase [Flavobacterium flevense]SHM13834.1 2-desacetyl-2-hydroxyethyl bacteriochlorophyllide A dehydrogenase [Flavobacterium flevense]